MSRRPLDIGSFVIEAQSLWAKDWLLLTSGDFSAGRYNAMTVGWGSFGVMWSLPFAQVVVRPVRHTYTFMEEFDTFTLCAFPESCRDALKLLGTASGRDGDKIAKSGLTPTGSAKIQAPGYAEASLIVECRKIYQDDFDPSRFLDPRIEACYPQKDYHRVYFGEILHVEGEDRFARC